MMSGAEQMLASANGLYSFGQVLGQGTKGLISATKFEESLNLQRQAAAALTRSLNASEQAQRLGNLAVNISNHAIQRIRHMAMLRDQGVNDPYSTHHYPFGPLSVPGESRNSQLVDANALEMELEKTQKQVESPYYKEMNDPNHKKRAEVQKKQQSLADAGNDMSREQKAQKEAKQKRLQEQWDKENEKYDKEVEKMKKARQEEKEKARQEYENIEKEKKQKRDAAEEERLERVRTGKETRSWGD